MLAKSISHTTFSRIALQRNMADGSKWHIRIYRPEGYQGLRLLGASMSDKSGYSIVTVPARNYLCVHCGTIVLIFSSIDMASPSSHP